MLLAFLLVSGVGGFLMAGMAVPFVTAAGTVANSTTGLFNELPGELDIDKPSEQSIMLAADGSVLATFYADNRIIVGADEMAPSIREAIVAVEDRRFYEHNGVDVEGMGRAFVNNAVNSSTEGASTLTQQYVKNILIERSRVSGDQELFEQATTWRRVAAAACGEDASVRNRASADHQWTRWRSVPPSASRTCSRARLRTLSKRARYSGVSW